MKTACVVILLSALVFHPSAVAQERAASKTPPRHRDTQAPNIPMVTFIELGSVKCIPCKAMQPVMKSIEGKYGRQLKVVFYDVWKAEQAHYAADFRIRVIPTQIFLDARGNEIMRHEGFYPEKEIDAFLQSRGLKPGSGTKE